MTRELARGRPSTRTAKGATGVSRGFARETCERERCHPPALLRCCCCCGYILVCGNLQWYIDWNFGRGGGPAGHSHRPNREHKDCTSDVTPVLRHGVWPFQLDVPALYTCCSLAAIPCSTPFPGREEGGGALPECCCSDGALSDTHAAPTPPRRELQCCSSNRPTPRRTDTVLAGAALLLVVGGCWCCWCCWWRCAAAAGGAPAGAAAAAAAPALLPLLQTDD